MRWLDEIVKIGIVVKWLNKPHVLLCVVAFIITGIILGTVQGGAIVYHLSPIGSPFGGNFLYLLYFIGIYVLISSGMGLLIGLLPTKFLKGLILLVLIIGLPLIAFITLFLLKKWGVDSAYCPGFIRNILYGYPRFIPNAFSAILYAILFLFLGTSIYFFLSEKIGIYNFVKIPLLLLPIISLIFCLSFYRRYTAKYMLDSNSAFAMKLNSNPDNPHPTISIEENNRNIILIVVDTLRADHLSCYGYQRLTSPNIDNFAQQGVLFTNAIVQKTKTNPSVASILTGTYPYTHGIDATGEVLYEDAVTIGEVLKKYDYRTASVVSNGNLGYYLNFDQGFDKVFEVWKPGSTIAENVNKYAISWLEENYQDKFFLYVHYIDPHTKYTPPLPYSQSFVNDEFYGELKDIKIEIGSTYWNKIFRNDPLLEGPHQTDLDYYISQYDGEIRYCDEYIGKLFAKIKELELDKNTLIILTADHGEDLGEHDVYFDHGILAYETCARVPLVISFPPAFKPKTVNGLVETIDLFPTILEFLGIKPMAGLPGNSLAPILVSKDVVNTNLKQFGFVEGNYGAAIIKIIRTKDWKLLYKPYLLHKEGDALDLASMFFPSFVWNSWSYFCAVYRDGLKNYNLRYELYNIAEDPNEQDNLYFKRQDIAIPLKEKLMAWLKEHPRLFVKDIIGKTKKKKLQKETLENLKALGYIQ